MSHLVGFFLIQPYDARNHVFRIHTYKCLAEATRCDEDAVNRGTKTATITTTICMLFIL